MASTQNAAEKISNLEDKAQKKTEAFGDKINPKNVTDLVRDSADNIKEMGAQYVDEAKEYASDLATAVQERAGQVPEMIRKYPVQSLIAGFGIGFLAAVVLTRALSD